MVAGVFGDCSLESNYYINLCDCGKSSKERLGKRLNVIIGDSKDVVICEIDENEEAEGVWTTTPSIVLISKEYIKHDIWGNVQVDTVGHKEFAFLCEKNSLLSYLIKNR